MVGNAGVKPAKKTKGQFVGVAWSEGILYFVSDIAIVCAFLSICPVSTDFPAYAVKQCCLLETNRVETLRMDTVQEAAAVDKKISAVMPSPRPQSLSALSKHTLFLVFLPDFPLQLTVKAGKRD